MLCENSFTWPAAGPRRLLAGPPLAPREYHEDQGDSALVQQELHPQDERFEGDGNPGQPVADQAAPGVPEALAPVADGQPVRPTCDPASAGLNAAPNADPSEVRSVTSSLP